MKNLAGILYGATLGFAMAGWEIPLLTALTIIVIGILTHTALLHWEDFSK